MRDYETLQVSLTDHVGQVTLNRPQVHNAFNEQMLAELQELWRELATDPAVRAVIVTGAGERAFCTGIDRTESLSQPRPTSAATGSPFAFDDPGKKLGPKSNGFWRPVIASVNGMACGGAFYLLGEADIIIAAEGATFFDPHVTYGMASAFESIHMLSRMPLGEVLRMQLLGSYERLSAGRALQIGLVSEVVPAAELAGAALQIARDIAAQPPLAIEATLRAIWGALDLPRTQALESATSYIRLGNSPQSLQEGQQRFQQGQRVPWRLR